MFVSSLPLSIAPSLAVCLCISVLVSLTSGSHLRQLPDNALLIKNVKREDAGTYFCQAKITGRMVEQRLSVSVVVNGQYILFLIKMK